MTLARGYSRAVFSNDNRAPFLFDPACIFSRNSLIWLGVGCCQERSLWCYLYDPPLGNAYANLSVRCSWIFRRSL